MKDKDSRSASSTHNLGVYKTIPTLQSPSHSQSSVNTITPLVDIDVDIDIDADVGVDNNNTNNNISDDEDTLDKDIDLDSDLEPEITETYEDFLAANPGNFFTSPGFRTELRATAKMSIPLILGFLANNAISIINLIFLGHLSDEDLAAAALGMLFCNITGVSIGIGMLSGFDTLASQAYGAHNYKHVGVLLQRGLYILSIEAIPIAILWYFSGSFLAITVEEVVAKKAEQYVRTNIVGLLIIFYTTAIRRYLEIQQTTIPVMVGTLISVCASPLLNMLYIYKLDLGHIGAAWTVITTNCINFLVMFCYIYFSGFYKKTWPGWCRKGFQDWWSFIKLGISGTGMLCAEWWSFEVHTLIAGLQGTTVLGAMALFMNLTSFLFMVSMGLGTTAATRVGQNLGNGRPYSAHLTTKVCLVLVIISQIVIALILVFAKHTIISIFTEDPKISKLLAELMPILSIFCILDGIQAVCSGIMRGLGKQFMGFIVNTTSYWGFAIPAGYYVALYFGEHYRPPNKDEPQDVDVLTRGLGLHGQWVVLTITALIVCIAVLLYIYLLDWTDVSRGIVRRERSRKGQNELQNEDTHQDDDLNSENTFNMTSNHTNNTIDLDYEIEMTNKSRANNTASPQHHQNLQDIQVIQDDLSQAQFIEKDLAILRQKDKKVAL